MTSFLTADFTTIPRPDSPIERIENIGVLENTECTLPYKDKRSGKCIIPMDMKAVDALESATPNKDKTLQIALRIRYITPDGRKKCFHGPVLEPFYDFDAGTVTVDAIGPEDRVATAYIVKGDSQITEGVFLDGLGFRELLGSAQNRPNQDALNWPSLGIIPGVNTATPSSDARKMSKGDEIWTQGFIELGKLLVAPDWAIEDIETDPTTVAIGTITEGTDTALPSASVTNIPLVSGLPGIVGKMRVGVRIDVDNPYTTKIELIHPDGVTKAVLWNGPKVVYGTHPSPPGAETFGDGDADGNLLFFADKGDLVYGTRLDPITAFPLVGQFFTPDSPTATFFEQDASGTWVLRITTGSGSSGTFKYGTLRFSLPEPAYARFNTFDPESSTDPPIRAKFHKGFGRENARVLNVRTMGSYVRNQAIILAKDGDTQAIGVDDVSRYYIGTRQMFESSGEFDNLTILEKVADARVEERAWPPLTLELTPEIDYGQAGLPRALYDYRAGQHISGHAKRGRVERMATALVNSINLKQTKSGVETTLDLLTSVPEDAP